jgi:hypothetical protein
LGKQKNIRISGKRGKVIYYVVNGEGRTRSMPKKVRRTKSTKKSARHFGKAVRLSAAIRNGLASLLPELKGRAIVNGTNNACNRWMHAPKDGHSIPEGELPYLYQLQFNAKIALMERFKSPLQVDWATPGIATLILPPINPVQNISAPAGTAMVHLRVAITGCTIKDWMQTDSFSASMDIPYTDAPVPAHSFQLPYATTPGGIFLVAVALTYTVLKDGKSRRLQQQPWMPAGVVSTRLL